MSVPGKGGRQGNVWRGDGDAGSMGALGSHRQLVGLTASSGRGSVHSWGLYPPEMSSCPGQQHSKSHTV